MLGLGGGSGRDGDAVDGLRPEDGQPATEMGGVLSLGTGIGIVDCDVRVFAG